MHIRIRTYLLFGGLLIALVIAGFAVRGHAAETERRKVFEQAWKIVDENFYDRSMNGFDWPEVRKTYLQKLPEVQDSKELYSMVLAPMLMLLESSHVQAISPATVKLHNLSDASVAGIIPDNPDLCGGIMIAFPNRSVSPRVASIDEESFLHDHGIRANWRMYGLTNEGEQPTGNVVLTFMSTAGEKIQIPIGPTHSHFSALATIREDFKALGGLIAERAEPTTRLRMNSLGLTVAIGQNPILPTVIDVRKDSEADLAGVEPGSAVMRYRRSDIVDGFYSVDAGLISVRGDAYDASFKFAVCEIEDRSAELLPGNVLHLRFDGFMPDITPWLDEQLRKAPRALVLDLRTNSGGYASVLLQVMGRFMEAGTNVGQEVRADGTKVLEAANAPFQFKGPVAVLITQLSTSAAEVAAGAFQAHGRAKLYGQTTRGDVLIGRRFGLADGGMIAVAIADTRTPDAKRLENVGVKPDHEIMPTLETVRAGRDVVLEAALADLAQTTH